MGVRQHRDPVQGVRPAGRAAHAAGEDRRRRAGARVHRRGAERGGAHPLGQGGRLRGAGRLRARPRGRRSGPSTRTSSRTTTTGSAASPTPTRRCARKALDHLLECVDIMDATGSRDLKLWFADGTNYPGQDDIRARQDRLAEALARCTSGSGRTSGCCWSTSCSSRRSTPPTCRTGAPRCCTAWRWAPKAPVVVDTGHHAPGTNIEFIVAVSCCGPGGSAGSTSTAASTPTTTSWSAPPTRSSCSASCTRWCRPTRCGPRRASRSCSTSATTSSRRSRPRSAR